MTKYQVFLIIVFLFFFGSGGGWVLELFFRRFFSGANPERKWLNPGFLFGPCVPLYGFGTVVLFVLSEDRSLVPYSDRMAMVKAACAKYGNVSVVSSGSYMISSATFPSYFLKDADVVTRTHAELDATLFTRIAAALNLTRRYVGEEPFSHTTSLYNEALAAVLPKAGVKLVVIPRAQAQGEAISASHVRQLIHDGHIEAIRPLVPETTYAYLAGDAGQTVLRRIQAAADVIHH